MNHVEEVKDFLKFKDVYCVMRIVHKEDGQKKGFYVSKDLESTTTPKYFKSVEHAFYIKSLIKSKTGVESEYKVFKLKAKLTKVNYDFKENYSEDNSKEKALRLIK